jgi:FixJ family two-component response regulator
MVFLVADDPDMLKAIVRTVASAGWPIHTYVSGEAFLHAYDRAKPAVSYSICACRM